MPEFPNPVIAVGGRDLVDLIEDLLKASSKFSGYVRLMIDEDGIKCSVIAPQTSSVWSPSYGGVEQ